MTFVFNDRQSSFTIENMPVWTGMKTSQGVDHTHGATQGLNTFIHVTGIGQFSFDLYDGDQTKAGKFLPAYSKPVKHVTETDYASHDILIISAMSFFDAIETQALKAGYRPEQLLPMTVDHLQKDMIS